MSEWKGIYIPFNALSGYIGTATSEGMFDMNYIAYISEPYNTPTSTVFINDK